MEPRESCCISFRFIIFEKQKFLIWRVGMDEIRSFFKNGYQIKGIDISSVAIDIVKESFSGKIEFIVGDLMEMPFAPGSFDVVFGNFILHLFSFALRQKMLKECHRVLKQGGLAVFSVASVDDPDYGTGQEVEKDCFVNSRGVAKFYYSKESVNKEFTLFEVMEIMDIEEFHEHDSPHTHKSYLIIAKKSGINPNIQGTLYLRSQE